MSSKDAKPFTVADLKETTEGVYSFKYNKSWVKSSEASLPVAYGDNASFTKSNAGFAFAPSQSIGGEWEDHSDTQKTTFIDTYSDYVEKNLPSSLGCETVGDLNTNKDYQISGIDKVVKIDVSCEKLKAGYSVNNAKMNLLMMVKGSKAHIAVAISGPIESYDKSATAFEAIFQSIKIEE
mgnify:CR=1 FL=1